MVQRSSGRTVSSLHLRHGARGRASAAREHSSDRPRAVEGFAAPASDAGGSAPEEQPSASESLPRGSGELILVVDDEQYVLELTCTVLQRFGYRAEPAMSVDEAVLLFTRDPRPDYRLLITDLSMPGGGGARLIERVRSLDAGTPIVVMSAYFDAAEYASLPEEAIQAKLAKPYSVEQLLEATARAIKSAQEPES